MADEKKDEKLRRDTLELLYPGKVVELETARGKIAVKVYPLGFKHLRKFSKNITGALLALLGGDVGKGVSDPVARAALGQRLMGQVIPYVIDNLLDLLEECVVFQDGLDITMDELPHWEVAKLIEVWLTESFGEEKKWRPWVAAVENLYATATGSRKSISEIFSKASSSPATVAPTS